MARGKRKPWEDTWRKLRELGRGGNGVTFLVDHYQKPGELYVLKELKHNHLSDPERRQRMYREVQALQQLDNPSLPKIIESNTDSFADIDVPLYFVMDYVVGQTLEERVKQGGNLLQPHEAVRLTIQLSDILIYCHKSGILHRDIKQDNIILRGDSSSDPVLIDFGLSFNEEDTEQSPLTPDGQQLGNRLLHLPELQTGDSTKRYVESDISQVCAVLFYALTGKAPVQPIDHEGLKPHQRASAKPMLAEIDSPTLTSLFDKGFEQMFSKRFRSFDAFKGRLHEVLDEFEHSFAFDQNVASVTLETITPEIRTTMSQGLRQESVSDQTVKAKETESRGAQYDYLRGEQADALMFASLLGSWNEQVEGDRDAIKKLIEGDD